MKQAKRVITLVTVMALLLSMASCALLKKSAKFTQEITAGNIKVTIRDDMKEMDNIKSDEDYITGFRWNGYGMNIGNIEANDATMVRYAGMTADDILKKLSEKVDENTEIKKFGNISYMEYLHSFDGTEYRYSIYILEEGYEYYFFEFYTLPDSIEKYREEYEKILSSVTIIEEPAKTVDANVNGIVFTLDGDAFEQSDGSWICGRYSVSVTKTNIKSSLVPVEEFIKRFMANGFKTADGSSVTILNTTKGGVLYFEAVSGEYYSTNYIKDIDGTLYYILISTMVAPDTELRSAFNDIVDGAHTA